VTPEQDETDEEFSLDQIELRGFSRSLAELEWLLLVLVLLFFVAPGVPTGDPFRLIVAMSSYALLIVAFRYLKFYRRETRWKLAIETWVMVAFITGILWETGKAESPLINLYLLVIIASGLTLGKTTTMLQLLLVASIYFLSAFRLQGEAVFTIATISDLMAKFAPFLLTAYLVTMLSADLHYAKKVFRLLSETDDMTGIQNRRAFQLVLEREAKQAARYKRRFSVLMIDADGLKAVNDDYGHEAGDRLIKLVATSIKEGLRASDSCARYGGDEFVALLPEADQAQAVAAGERIRRAVVNSSFDYQGNSVSASVSIGVATCPDHGSEIADLMRAADQALYSVKKGGGNDVAAAVRQACG
jgi:diguanylate cyclase (GGDEF)-like protein